MLFKTIVLSLAAAVLASPVDTKAADAPALDRRQGFPASCLDTSPLRIICRKRYVDDCVRRGEFTPCRQGDVAKCLEWCTGASYSCPVSCYVDAPPAEWIIPNPLEGYGHDDRLAAPADCPVDGEAYKTCYALEKEWCHTKYIFCRPDFIAAKDCTEFCPQWADNTCRRACHV